MNWIDLERMKDLGWKRIHAGQGLSGERVWYVLVGGEELHLCRQRDGAVKCADGFHNGGRKEALALYHDALFFWMCGTCGGVLPGQDVTSHERLCACEEGSSDEQRHPAKKE